MSSWTEEVSVNSGDADPLIREIQRWTEVTVQLDSDAQGETRFGFSKKRSPLQPGSVYRMMLAPGVRLEADTTSASTNKIRIWYTEHTWIEDIVRVLCQLAAGVKGG